MPVLKFVTWIAEKVAEVVDKEYYSPEAIQSELMILSEKLDADEITEEEYNVRETELMERLAKTVEEDEG